MNPHTLTSISDTDNAVSLKLLISIPQSPSQKKRAACFANRSYFQQDDWQANSLVMNKKVPGLLLLLEQSLVPDYFTGEL